MRRQRILRAVVLLLLAASPPQGSADADLAAAVSSRHLSEAVRVFRALPHPGPADQFLVGSALMSLHEPLQAEAPLRAAKAAGYGDLGHKFAVDTLLDRIGVFRECVPPSRTISGTSPSPGIAVYAGAPTEWSKPVLHALPEFAEVGRRIFGKEPPSLSFYLFADRPTFDRFFAAIFGGPIATAWQDGTGTLGVVTFCEWDREGKRALLPGLPETVSCVLHEFGHAWIGTYLMERHGREWLGPSMRKPWLDEGLADLVASLREPAFLDRRADWLRDKVAKGIAAPEFEELKGYDSFYKRGDIDVHYWFSALFVADLVGRDRRAPETLRKILDEAGRSGDPERAIQTVTGKDLGKEFESVLRRFW